MKKLLSVAALAFAMLAAGCPAMAQSQNGPINQSDQDPAPISMSTATTTQLIAASGFKTIYVAGGLVYAGGTTAFTFKAGTGTNCGTGTRSLTGPMPLDNQGGFLVGSGLGVSLRLRAGEALCATSGSAVQVSGWLVYSQR